MILAKGLFGAIKNGTGRGGTLALLLLCSLAPLLLCSFAPASSPSPLSTVTLLAAGDNLLHAPILRQERQRSGDSFSDVYKALAPAISGAGLSFVNQEGCVSNAGPFTGYPRFRAPTSALSAISGAGFDVVGPVNNHMLDYGVSGFSETLSAIEGAGLFPAYSPPGENPKIITKNGIRFVFLSYTAFVNPPHSARDIENMGASLSDTEAVRRSLQKARELCDVLVVSAHFGEEGALSVSREQRGQAAMLCHFGADIVLGHHPHVVQGYEQILTGDGRRAAVFYSLGNFVSTMTEREELVGIMPTISVEKNAKTGAITLSEPKIQAVITYYETDFSGVRVLPLRDYTESMAKKHGANRANTPFTPDWIYSFLERQLATDRFL